MKAGGVGCVERVRNAIALARLVLDESPHVYFVAEGAERFAQQHGMKLIEQVRGLNRASVRAATHELDGPRAVREIARLQERMHFLVDGMRDVAGKEGRS